MWRHKNEEDKWKVKKKTPEKEIDNPSFLLRHMADFWETFPDFYKSATNGRNSLVDVP